MPDPITLIIVYALCGAAGFVDAVAGGGGLISLPAYLLAGLPVHVALGAGKLSSMLGVSVVTWKYSRNGFVPWREAVACGSLGGSAHRRAHPEHGPAGSLIGTSPRLAVSGRD